LACQIIASIPRVKLATDNIGDDSVQQKALLVLMWAFLKGIIISINLCN
jgi:hypothetical protein